ncbi:MAG: hypothetical protein PHQ34_00455 [Methanothrix sp.]|nr:hypothetical protein [Methanothrix sp.]
MTRKNGWNKPQLTIVTRSNAEENVLINCKQSLSGGGVNADNGGCYITGACPLCHDHGNS